MNHINDLSLLATTIRDRRLALNLNQLELAQKCTLTPSYICKIESQKEPYLPSSEAIASIAEALELNDYQLQLYAGHIPSSIKTALINILLEFEAAEEAIETIEWLLDQRKTNQRELEELINEII